MSLASVPDLVVIASCLMPVATNTIYSSLKVCHVCTALCAWNVTVRQAQTG